MRAFDSAPIALKASSDVDLCAVLLLEMTPAGIDSLSTSKRKCETCCGDERRKSSSFVIWIAVWFSSSILDSI